MSENENALSINMNELVDFSIKIIDRAFVNNSKEKAKQILSTLKKRLPHEVGSLTVNNRRFPIFMELDNKEFVGPGFNVNAMHYVCRGLIDNISKQLQSPDELSVLTSKTGAVLIDHPGAIEKDGQKNVLVLTFDFSHSGKIIMKLVFLQPDQFDKAP